ncbi:MAG: NFACT family protein [Nanobdellota archaeon]
MTQFSCVDIYKWIRDNKDKLVNSRITQIYRHSPSLISFGIRNKDKKQFLIARVPEFIHLSENKPESHKETVFGSWTRNNIKSLRIKDIRQPGSERILILDLGKHKIYFELFGIGNIIITDEDGKIQISLKKMEDRDIEKERMYEVSEKDYFNIQEKELKQMLIESQKTLSKFIATELHLGGKIAKEICDEAGISHEKNTDPEDAAKIKESLKKILEKSFDKQIPDDIFSQKSEADKKFDKAMKKYQKIIEIQRKSLEENRKKADKYSRIGEIIYENYNLLNELKQKYDEGKLSQEFIDLKEKELDISYKKPNLEIEVK